MALNGVRCFCDFKIFEIVEVLFWRIIASTLGHVTCLLEIQGVSKKKVIELCSALARSLYNLQKLLFRRRKDQALSFRLSSFL